MKVAILLIEGTNCEDETLLAFQEVGVEAEKVHLKQFGKNCSASRKRNLLDYQVLLIPGGWSAGDYIRAGSIFAARMKSMLGKQLARFVDDGRLVGGICNGFQILVEMGLLPGFDGISEKPQAALTTNKNGNFQCRPAYLKHVNSCMFTSHIPKGDVWQVPVAHAEGRLTFGENEDKYLSRLIENEQIVFRYCRSDGSDAKGEFPWNPNGSLDDIAGICNPQGNVLGMMPHPERVIHGIQEANWTRTEGKEYGDGKLFFESIAKYLKEK